MLVGQAFEVPPLDHLHRLPELQPQLLRQGELPLFAHDPGLSSHPDVGVARVRLDAHHLVGDHGEGHGGPDHEVAPVGNLHLVVEARVLKSLVAEHGLGVAERGHAAGAVGDDLVPLAEYPPRPGALEELPLPLDVAVAVGHVGLRVVQEEPEEVVGLLPRLQVLAEEALARLHELLLPYLLEVLPLVPGEPELLLGLELDGEPLAVPARAEDHVLLEQQGAVAVPKVLHYPPAYVPDVRDAVESRWPLYVAHLGLLPQGL